MRRRLAPAFVTTAVSTGCACALSGCAWTLGGGAEYAHAGSSQNAVAAHGRVAWGFGGGRNALTIAADLGLGASPSHGGVWVRSTPRLEWSWLPRRGRVGGRVGAGGMVATGVGEFIGGPAVTGELTYALSTSDEDGFERGYRATLLGLGLHLAYDLAGPQEGPVFALAASVTYDGVLPFGNPPRVRPTEARPVMQVATDPPPR